MPYFIALVNSHVNAIKKVLLVQLVAGYSNFWQALQKIPIQEIPKITNDRNYWKKQQKQPAG